MSEQRYDIYFRGEALEGFTIDTVKNNVAQLFKAAPDKVDMLFSGKVVPLKKNLDKPTAAKFKQALDKAGAKIYIKLSAETNTAATPTASHAPTETATAQKTVPEQKPTAVTLEKPAANQASATNTTPDDFASDNLVILPPGSDVLRPEERHAVEAVNVDTSSIRMASVFDTPEVDTPPPPPAPDTSHISAAPVGADILEGVKKEAPPPPPDVSNINISEPGADMSEMVEKMPIPPSPDISHLSMATAGADLLEGIQKETPPPPPDISHIHLGS